MLILSPEMSALRLDGISVISCGLAFHRGVIYSFLRARIMILKGFALQYHIIVL